MQSGFVPVDGADIYYERRGTGPALLMIPGGVVDAAGYERVADLLADEYTVLTYDRRGNSRSRLHGPAGPLEMAQQSADAVAVLARCGFADGLVFGNSAGAVIGLDLATRYPRAVAGLVAHEPPAIAVLPDAAERIAFFHRLDRIRAEEGPWPAFVWFTVENSRADPPQLLRYRPVRRVAGGLFHRLATGMASGRPPWVVRATLGRIRRRRRPDLADPAAQGLRDGMRRSMGNIEFFVASEMRPITDYVPDLAALAASPVPIRLAGGRDTRQLYYSRAGQVIAERLGLGYVEFPGGHTGYIDRAAEFAVLLRETLAALRVADRETPSRASRSDETNEE